MRLQLLDHWRLLCGRQALACVGDLFISLNRRCLVFEAVAVGLIAGCIFSCRFVLV